MGVGWLFEPTTLKLDLKNTSVFMPLIANACSWLPPTPSSCVGALLLQMLCKHGAVVVGILTVNAFQGVVRPAAVTRRGSFPPQYLIA